MYTSITWRLVPTLEKQTRELGKLSSPLVRKLWAKCPAILGKFDDMTDTLSVVIPAEGATEEQDVAMLHFANTTCDDFMKARTTACADGRRNAG